MLYCGLLENKDLGEDDRKDITDRINNKFYINDLNHPNIIKFKDCWFDSINFYFLAEFIEGEELFDYVANMNYSERNIIEIVKKLISASIYILNTAEFQFTDLKPHSIFVTQKGNTMSKYQFRPRLQRF
jgi:serine/threonine protein kinase